MDREPTLEEERVDQRFLSLQASLERQMVGTTVRRRLWQQQWQTLRRRAPSLVGWARVAMGGGGAVAVGIGLFAHFVHPVGVVAPPVRSLALTMLGLVAIAFGVALREAS